MTKDQVEHFKQTFKLFSDTLNQMAEKIDELASELEVNGEDDTTEEK